MQKLGSRWKRPKSTAGYCCLHRIPSKSASKSMVPQSMGTRQIRAKDCLNQKKRRGRSICPHFRKRKEHPMWEKDNN